MSVPIEIRRLTVADIGVLAEIDRSEQLEIEYTVVDGQLVAHSTDFHVPAWDPEGTGDHSVAAMVRFAEPVVATGATFMGAFRHDDLLGLAVIDAQYESGVAWLALLHVTRAARRSGAATALWAAAEQVAAAAGASRIYLSSTMTGSAVGFYLSRGCRLATRVEIIPALYELEPDDVHLICPVGEQLRRDIDVTV